MLTETRWMKEIDLMRRNFPTFDSFAEPPWFGFQGLIRGRKTGKYYEVVLEGHEDEYPQKKPAVYINPSLGPHWVSPSYYGWSGRPGRPQLCMKIDGWSPAYDTFASVLIRVIKYIEDWDA